MKSKKLFLFAKNTDAFNAQRGYNYQTLKTLETWISNFLDNNKEEIYCEFEEDIFQKDLLNQKLVFRQIKLYSSNFSFSSEEIKKCIAHFFILHVKSDYNNFEKEYVFETNSNIASKYKDNDADLLREWFESQDDLTPEKIAKYAIKVKAIVAEYIDEQKKVIKDKAELEEAIKIFEGLNCSFWEGFTKIIKWKFIGVSPDEEFSSIRDNIEALVQRLPYDLVKEDSVQIFGVLLDKVFTRITHREDEQRKITYDLLEQSILEISTNDDRWYSRRYDYYKNLDPIDEFRIGEFYEILDLVNYCRSKKYLHKHKDVWNPFLIYYARNEGISNLFRRNAIYEIIFLNNEFHKVDYEKLNERVRPKGSLVGFEEDIRFYFRDFTLFNDARSIEKGETIISLLFAAIGHRKVGITYVELNRWFFRLYRKVNHKLLTVLDINEKCNLLEQRGNIVMRIVFLKPERKAAEFIKYFDELFELVDQAPLFKLSQFGDRIEKYIKMILNTDPADKRGIVGELEAFSDKLLPLIEKREGRIALAKKQVERGVSYLKTTVPENLLKALDYFHKAKENYLQEDTIDGYILSLLNISQLYSRLGMHFAAKNYALAAFRMSTNKELVKNTENSLLLLFYADFRQGSWFNALNVYHQYIHLRLNSNIEVTNYNDEKRANRYVAFALYVMKRISPQFPYLINNFLQSVDYVGEEIIKPLQEIIDKEIGSEDNFKKAIEIHVSDFPLNDIGKERKIQFYALGSLWSIRFVNNFQMLAIAEEYISTIQIVLAEIALSKTDFHLLRSQIDIELILGKEHLSPEQIPSNNVIKWKVYVCHTETKEVDSANRHSAYNMGSLMYILNNVSVLKSNEFKDMFRSFFKETQISTKQIVVNLYQKIHRDIYTKKSFDSYQSYSFEKEVFDLNLPKENKFMVWNDSLSAKYDQQFSVDAIKNRFNNAVKSISLTLQELKKDPDFPDWINDLRSRGWKDWQIVCNMQNFMVNRKVRSLNNNTFASEQEWIENFQKMFYKYINMEEKDFYVKFPLKSFKSAEFMQQFDIMLPSTLHTYGLETKLMTPNFEAIREFLGIRFNMYIDKYEENNPLKDIKVL
ncbi:dsDNA nuclease domain-containing protein [Elizabethkingia anophelis]|uniref:dsDNA nuclease domain-containing protein n=1 Tax=Elizabethkingia anophelis TaxID=1117645 RepID=UPI0038922544